MKIQLSDIITRPEPSRAPFATLLFALVIAAAVASATAALLAGIAP